MNKKQKVNYIKCWLQKFGNRDNETFNTEVVVDETTWRISLQYDFDDEGNQCDPYDWCICSFKHLNDNRISDRTNEELDEIINQLKLKQSFY
jgi:hypothetical protein